MIVRSDPAAMRPPSSRRRLAFASVLVVCLLVVTSRARADAGSIDLRNGGRMQGTITEVVPRDHATVVLADGTTFIVPWSEIAFVVDGPRVFDGAGNQTSAGAGAAPAAPSAPAPGVESAAGLASPSSGSGAPQPVAPSPQALPPPPTYAPATPGYAPVTPTQYGLVQVRPIESDVNAYLRYRALPRRSWSILMIIGGGFGTFESLALFAAASEDDEPALIGVGIGVGALSGVLIGFGFKRLGARRRGMNELRQQGFFIAGRDRTLAVDLDLGVDVARRQIAPGLRLRF